MQTGLPLVLSVPRNEQGPHAMRWLATGVGCLRGAVIYEHLAVGHLHARPRSAMRATHLHPTLACDSGELTCPAISQPCLPRDLLTRISSSLALAAARDLVLPRVSQNTPLARLSVLHQRR
jgi:hypothetical protein